VSETTKLYPESVATFTWEYDCKQCSLLMTRTGHYCGYVLFAEKPMKEPGYNGILSYVPVHGGITYARAEYGGMVYGFDCAHLGDEHNPDVRDISWLKEQCERLADGIVLAAEYEDRYLLAVGDNEERAIIIEEFTQKLGGLKVTENFGVMLNLLSGQL